MPNQPPDYVPGHGLLREKKVVVTAAAGTGIGYATAKRCAEEGARVLISDIHERRLAEAAERLRSGNRAQGLPPPSAMSRRKKTLKHS